MNKQTVIKILTQSNDPTNIQLTQQEILEFIVDYVKDTKGKDIDGQELNAIYSLVIQNVFNIQYAAKQSAVKLGLNVMNVHNKNGQLIRVDVYE